MVAALSRPNPANLAIERDDFDVLHFQHEAVTWRRFRAGFGGALFEVGFPVERSHLPLRIFPLTMRASDPRLTAPLRIGHKRVRGKSRLFGRCPKTLKDLPTPLP